MYSLTEYENNVLEQAKAILTKVMESTPLYQSAPEFTTPDIAMQYLKTAIGLQEREHFMVLFLDNQHRLIKAETLFKGTVNSASVYPREIVKRTLNLNATAVIVAHNHPSGEVLTIV